MVVLSLCLVGSAAGSASAAADELPDNWVYTCYARLSHQVFLDRMPTDDEEIYWTAVLADSAGLEYRRLPQTLSRGDEWLESTVTDLYQRALDRTPERSGLAFWTARLRSGVLVNRVASFVFGSQELYQKAGDDEQYVAQLYDRILDRAPDQAGSEFWVQQLAEIGLDGVAARFFDSQESRAGRVVALYEQVLDRSPDGGGHAYWTERLRSIDDVELAVGLATSNEFIIRSGQVCDPPITAHPL